MELATTTGLHETVKDMLAGLAPREANALRKPRLPSRSEQLRSFLDLE